ncbi:hypothetical protein [Deferribacter desulfuricans]|uniref:hypothetical protein n=1 Tax=Deferribacter desulfuricans TaxID=197162 RepID=UPI0003059B7C|nr:hypothetical protein [Deferribacter desulfuricans]
MTRKKLLDKKISEKLSLDSEKDKPITFFGSRLLTDSEIESLRKKAEQADQFYKEFFSKQN